MVVPIFKFLVSIKATALTIIRKIPKAVSGQLPRFPFPIFSFIAIALLSV